MESHDGMSVDNKDSKESSTKLATELRQYIDAHMGSQPEKPAACNAPEPIFHAANFLYSLLEFKGTKLSEDKQARETDSRRAANNQFEALWRWLHIFHCAKRGSPTNNQSQLPFNRRDQYLLPRLAPNIP
jgi:hypothetical protein